MKLNLRSSQFLMTAWASFLLALVDISTKSYMLFNTERKYKTFLFKNKVAEVNLTISWFDV